MSKFKVGDLVRVLDGSNADDYMCGWTGGMNEFVGNTYTVEADYDEGAYHLEGICYVFDERYLELVEPAQKTVTIVRGDIVDAVCRVVKEDESTRELIGGEPLLILVFHILAEKIEDELFGGDADE